MVFSKPASSASVSSMTIRLTGNARNTSPYLSDVYARVEDCGGMELKFKHSFPIGYLSYKRELLPIQYIHNTYFPNDALDSRYLSETRVFRREPHSVRSGNFV